MSFCRDRRQRGKLRVTCTLPSISVSETPNWRRPVGYGSPSFPAWPISPPPPPVADIAWQRADPGVTAVTTVAEQHGVAAVTAVTTAPQDALPAGAALTAVADERGAAAVAAVSADGVADPAGPAGAPAARE